MSRYGIIDPTGLGTMEVLAPVSSEAILAARMARLKVLWTENDPPYGAAYDVDGLEFDPLKIVQEVGAFYETTLATRINQAAKDTTLAFGFGANLDAIGTRFPGGVPRLAGETDDRYRRRLWLAANSYSTAGAEEAYVFWAMTAVPELRDASATVTRTEDGPAVVVTCLAEGADPVPTLDQLLEVRRVQNLPGIKPLTVPVSVVGPRIIRQPYEADVWLLGDAVEDLARQGLDASVAAYLESKRWLGADHTTLGFLGALARPDIHSAVPLAPVTDVAADDRTIVVPDGVTIRIRGRRS